jgi:hypothetical protein
LLALTDPIKTLPVEINGVSLADSVVKILSVVEKYGSPELRADIGRYGPPLLDLPGLTYPKLLDRLRSVYLE